MLILKWLCAGQFSNMLLLYINGKIYILCIYEGWMREVGAHENKKKKRKKDRGRGVIFIYTSCS